ncbi:2-succinyl-6-hydroxy-2,4-cyclohexadiene-1-carboxylate synthase [uncultured archaeon]|nr:2-succinyl-6-hydroxy-2,4-cyclohexadiene-1-carboxylate synthase [uncultured archaeon]
MLYDDLDDDFVNTGVGRVHCKMHDGGGAKIVFLHGFAGSTRSWTRLVPLLPDDLCVCLLDLLGHGESEAPKIKYTVAVHVRAVRELMADRGLEDCYLFGHSYGGWIAASMAQQDFAGQGIILEDAIGLKDYFDDAGRERGEAAFKDKWAREARMFNLGKDVIDGSIGAELSGEFLTEESLSKIRKRTLVIWGDRDTEVDVKYGRLMSEYIAGSRLEIVPGGGHVSHYTNADTVKSVLMEFIAAGHGRE